MAIARYTLAVDRRFKRDNEPSADFINCVAFAKNAEFAQKYLHQGTKVAITGRIQTGSYMNKDGNRVYTTDVVIEEQEFAESKAAGESNNQETATNQRPPRQPKPAYDDFMSIPDDIENELPFS